MDCPNARQHSRTYIEASLKRQANDQTIFMGWGLLSNGFDDAVENDLEQHCINLVRIDHGLLT